MSWFEYVHQCMDMYKGILVIYTTNNTYVINVADIMGLYGFGKLMTIELEDIDFNLNEDNFLMMLYSDGGNL